MIQQIKRILVILGLFLSSITITYAAKGSKIVCFIPSSQTGTTVAQGILGNSELQIIHTDKKLRSSYISLSTMEEEYKQKSISVRRFGNVYGYRFKSEQRRDSGSGSHVSELDGTLYLDLKDPKNKSKIAIGLTLYFDSWVPFADSQLQELRKVLIPAECSIEAI